MGNRNAKTQQRTILDDVREIPAGVWSYRTIDAATKQFLDTDLEWHEFRDIYQTILEKAHETHQTQIDIEPYTFDLQNLMQIHKVARARQWKIKREEQTRSSLPIRYDRFHLQPLAEFRPYAKSKTSKTGRALIMPYVRAWYQKGGGYTEMIDSGLLVEGKTARHEGEAKWMVEQLSNSSLINYEIRLTALAIFTLDSFLYPLVQSTLCLNNQSKMSTLGPILALLGDCQTYSLAIDRLLYSGIVYFSSKHDAFAIKLQLRIHLETENDEPVKIDSFISATKNRSIAEKNNEQTCLYIVHIKYRRTVNAIDVSSLSRRSDEQEVLILPNVPFTIKKIECDTKNSHRHIVYLTVEN